MKISLFIGVLLFSACVSGFAQEKPVSAPAPEQWSIVPLLPQDTLCVLNVPNGQVLAAKLKQSGVGNILANVDIQGALQTYLAQGRFFQSLVELQLGRKIIDFAGLYGTGSLTLAIIGVKVLDGGVVLPEILIGCGIGEKAKTAMRDMDVRIERISSIAGGSMVVTKLPTGEVSVTRVSIPGIPFSLSYAVCEGTFLVSTADGRLERLLSTRFELKEQGKLGTPAPGTFSAQPAYTRALQRLGGEQDLNVFINTEKLYTHALMADLQQKKKDSGGFREIRAVTYSMAVTDRGIDETAYFEVPRTQRRGALALFQTGVWEPLLGTHSASAVAGVSFNIPPKRLLDAVLDIVEESNAETRKSIDAWFQELSRAVKIDVAAELTRTLLDHMAVSVTAPSRSPKLSAGFPGVIFSSRVRDLIGFYALIEKLKKDGGTLLEFTNVTDANGDITVLRPRPTAENPEPVQVVFCVQQEELLVSLTPLSLRDELQRRARLAQKADGAAGNLSDDRDYQTLRQRSGPAGQALLYLDVPAVAAAAYLTAVPYLQFQPRDLAYGLNPFAFPEAQAVVENLSTLMLAIRADDEGITVRDVSPFGVLPYLAVFPAIDIVRQLTSESHDVYAEEQRLNLEKIGKALKQFSAANAGKYPAALKELRRYIPAFKAEVFDRFVYRGAQETSNAVVAHSQLRQKGPIILLLQDGTALTVPRRGFKKILETGYVRPPDEKK